MVMQEAISKEDFERMQKGLPPKAKPKIKMPVYDPPTVKKQLKIEDIPIGEVAGFTAQKHVVTNTEGVKFIGADVIINIKGQNPMKGWMAEKDLLQLKQLTGRMVR